jgi:SAM-dependent methyltransferase
MTTMPRLLTATFASLAFLFAAAFAARAADEVEPPKPKQLRPADCVYVPTPNDVVEKMIDMAQIKKTDLVYDLGCGDGRMVRMAAKKVGCKGVGFEIVPRLVEEARKKAKKDKVDHLVKIEQEDIFTLDIAKAQVLLLYLLPNMEKKLIPQFEKLKDGARIVVHDYPIAGMTPDKSVTVTSNEDGVKHTLYLYTLPFKKEQGEAKEEE